MIRTAFGFSIFALFGLAAFGFEVGETVVVIRDANLKIGNDAGDKVWPGLEVKIAAIEGEWLWVNNGHPGWLDSRNVVPMEKAIPILTDMIRRTPWNAALYSGRASVWMAKREYDIAIGDLNESIRLDPSAAHFSNRGIAWHIRGNNDRAIADFNEAIKLDPKYVLAYRNRGMAFQSKGESDKAIADYQEALRLDPTYVLAYSNRGMAFQNKGEFDKAIADYNEAIRLDQKFSLAYSNRASAWQSKGEFNKAVADYTTAIRLDPKEVFAYAGRGHAFGHLGEFAKAIADFEVVTQLDPKNPDGYNDLAWIYATCSDDKIRDGKRAIDDAKKSCELTHWKIWHYVDTLAAAYAEAGDWDNAIKRQRQVIEMAHDEKSKQMGQERLELYQAKQPHRDLVSR